MEDGGESVEKNPTASVSPEERDAKKGDHKERGSLLRSAAVNEGER